MRSIGSFCRLVFHGLASTDTTEIAMAMLLLRRLTLPARTDVSPSAQRGPPRIRRLAASLLVASAARRVPRAPVPVAFALAVLAVLATVAPEQAAAQTVTTFITNTGQTSLTASTSVRATAFTTGTGTGTYTLSSVGIYLDSQSGSPTPVVQIYGDTGGNPGTLVATMTNPGTIVDNAINIFTAPANTTLSTSTTYWVVTSNSAPTNGTRFRVRTITNTTLDSGTAAGWSIGDALFKNDSTATSWNTSSARLRFEIRGTPGTTTTNPPTVANTIPDQTATAGTAFSDADGDTLTYMATKADGTALPMWLSFADSTRTFSGTPQTADIATVSVKVTASDGNGGSVSDEFDITVSAPPDTTPPALTGATVPVIRSYIDLRFSEKLRAFSPAPDSAYTITADGIELGILDTGNIRDTVLRILYWPAVHQGQAVVLTYTDPTSGDDTRALQDIAGNDVATFTTGMNGVPAVTNNSTLAPTVPGAPTSLTATASGSTRINLTWTAPADNGGRVISGYRIEVSPNGTSNWTDRVANTNSTATTYAHTGLALGTTRHYRVSAINANGTGDPSNVDATTTGTTVPGAATSLTATASGSTRINLTWNAPASTGGSVITGYRIEVSPNGTSNWTDRVANTNSTATTYAHTGLAAGDTRHYRVSAINANGTGNPSNVDNATTGTTATTVPGAPTSLTATASGSTRINLTWNAPASTGGSVITGYRIEVSPNGTSNWTDRVATTNSTATTYAHTGLAAGDTRHYRVSAINANGTGNPSNVDNATTGTTATTVPGAPTSLTATASGSTRINLTWNAPASTGGSVITGYRIEVSPNGTSNWTDRVATTNSTATTYAHTGLAAGDTRHYRVSAINANGTGNPSNVDNATTGTTATTVPGAPTSLTATASGSTRINLTWNAPASTGGSVITGYRIEVSPNGTSNWTDRVATTNSTATTYAHTGLAVGTTRHYRVSAINANGTGNPSNVDNATTGTTATTVPGAPTSLTATASGSTRINLTWNAPASTGGSVITGYRIEVSPNGTSNWTDRVATTNSTATTYAHTGLAVGTTRHYRVSAINANGTGATSNVANATTDYPITPPGAPEPLTATAGDGEVFLEWTAPADDGGSLVTDYEYRYAPGDGVPRNTPWRSAGRIIEGTVAALTNGQQYVFEVRALNDVGPGAPARAVATPLGVPGAPEPLTAIAGDGEVFLEWTEPADDGGSLVTGYEYRYAPGDGVPEDTPWQSAGLNLDRTVGGLTNGQQYAFEVRARNRVGEGEARGALATPVGLPGAPASLTATAGDEEVALVWSAPADDGGAPITGYEYRHAAGDAVLEDTPWRSAGLNLNRTVTGLTNGQQYAFEVRARNRVGEGEARGALATPVGLPGASASLTATEGDEEVALVWSAPADDGGAPITGYEYRHAAGGAVLEDTPWRSAGLNLNRTVTGLTNGQQYAFEVRARNRVGEGEARGALATPVGLPGASASLTATEGDKEVALAWSAPVDDGGTPVTGYEYRYAAGAAVPESVPWRSAGLNLDRTVTGLTNGQQYAFEVRARNRVGKGKARAALATPVGVPGAPASLTATEGDKEVALAWSAPVDDGGTPVTDYEYRYAAGDAVPVGTPWQSAGLNLERTVTGLTNGQQYAFEVRARNRVGEGEARGAVATPVGPPGAPASLAATAGDGEVVMAWSTPVDDGGTPVTGYEYRHAAGDAVPVETTWQEADADRTATVTGLENETRYAFEVRARNRVGPGEVSMTTALPLRLRAELFSSTAAAEGEPLVVGVRRSGGLAFEAHAYIGVTDNAFPGVSATEEGRDDGLGRHRLEFATGEAEVTVTVTVAFDGERRQDRVLTATLDSAQTVVDSVTRAYEPIAPTLVVPVTEGDAGLSVADARVQGKSAVLAFTVSMDRTRDVAVKVEYATEDGSAKAGEDYTAVTGTLTIEAGGREGTVEVPVLPALHVTGERTLTLMLSNATNAVIDDGVATGTIVRESELPKAWLARFGRAASDHVAQAIARRLEAGERETHMTVAGRRLDGLIGKLRSGRGGLLGLTARNMARRATSGLAASAGRSVHPDGPGAGSGESAESLRSAVLQDSGFRLPEVREALLGSSFYVQGGAQQAEGGGKAWAMWGDVATTHFEADAGGLGLNGDVTTGTVGLDRQWRKLLVGLALARSGGEGAYGGGAGTITSTLTSMHPYLRFRVGERAHLWGAMGWGRGGMRLTPGSGAGIETDVNNSMAALGGRAVLRRAGATGSSLEIALRSDMLWTSMSSDEAGVLAAATGTVSRGRLMLEGAGRISGFGGVLHPSVEGGLRYDGGDAETGAGLEVGGGLDWARGGLALSVNGRMLLAYADESYEEWGYSGSLIYEPGTDGRGLRMRLGSRTGATASGVQSLWALENANGLVRGGGLPFKQRFDAEVGFGLGASALWYPYLATDASGQRRFGLKLNSDRSLDVGVEFGRMNDGTQPSRDALVLRGDIRF